MATCNKPPIPACPKCGSKDWRQRLIGWGDSMEYRLTPDGDLAHVYTDFNIYDFSVRCGTCKLDWDDEDLDPDAWDQLNAVIDQAEYRDEVPVD
jgi:hypothetical protein